MLTSFGASRSFIMLMALSLLVLAGCAGSRGGPVAYDRADFTQPDAPATIEVAADHRLSSGDVITINVYQVADMSGDQEVDSLGRIQMSLIGLIDVQGLTTDQVAANLTNRLNSSYLRHPQVQVTLKSVRQRAITVDGSVTQPGVYPVTSTLSLVQAVALARGPTADANIHRVVVFRQINGQRQAAAFDLQTIRRGQDPDPQVYPDDVIVVDGSRARQVFRDFLSSVPLLTIFRPF